MSLTFDPEIAAALAPMAQSGFTPPAVGDIAGRRAMWEPIIGAASTAQPIPADVTTSEHHATAHDGARIKLRWYVAGSRARARPLPCRSRPSLSLRKMLSASRHCAYKVERCLPRRRRRWPETDRE